MISQYLYPNLILKVKFENHKKYKKELLKLINKTDDEDWKNRTELYNDKLKKTDWPKADDWSRPWIKLIADPLYLKLQECAQKLGYKNIKLHKMWYQQYSKGDLHNWHIHDGSYTGTYYLEFDKKAPSTQFLFPSNLNKGFTIDVEEGDILFFPCSLIHRSPTSKSNKIKSIISWNIDFDLIQTQYLRNLDKVQTIRKEKNDRRKR